MIKTSQTRQTSLRTLQWWEIITTVDATSISTVSHTLRVHCIASLAMSSWDRITLSLPKQVSATMLNYEDDDDEESHKAAKH